jgi:hypothetical protein
MIAWESAAFLAQSVFIRAHVRSSAGFFLGAAPKSQNVDDTPPSTSMIWPVT